MIKPETETIEKDNSIALPVEGTKKVYRHFKSLRNLLENTNRRKFTKFEWTKLARWTEWGAEHNNWIEAKLGVHKCRSCSNEFLVLRQVLNKKNGDWEDSIRIEQDIEEGTGRSSKTFSLAFLSKERERVQNAWTACPEKFGIESRGNDGSEILLERKQLLIVSCAHCVGKMEWAIQYKTFKGEERVKAFLQIK